MFQGDIALPFKTQLHTRQAHGFGEVSRRVWVVISIPCPGSQKFVSITLCLLGGSARGSLSPNGLPRPEQDAGQRAGG
eukprot:9812849-Heterocapsa_arctica.AAC.1